jgi:hypothetical protein
MPQSPQPKSYLPQPPSTTPSRGEPRLPDAILNAPSVRPTDAVSQRRSIRPTRFRPAPLDGATIASYPAISQATGSLES